MKILLSWLKEFTNIDLPPEEIAKILTMLGLEVESFEPLSPTFDGVVVGYVVESEKHPAADQLSIAKVSDGKDVFQVVCGAPNCRKGIKIAFARLGATLKEEDGKNFVIRKAKLRGIESFGMLCSEKELGLSTESDKIMELPNDYILGNELVKYYEDIVFDISLTPNLNHCASVYGIARELAAATKNPLMFPQIKIHENSLEYTRDKVKVQILDFANCPRYSCRLIQNVNVGPSPTWLQKRLEACGFRSVNNIVDITNYVLLELGHPLHAFDYTLLQGQEIIVRNSSEGEKFTTLDNKERILTKEMLIICDQNGPKAIAGIMGGLNSEVSDKTQNVLLESAYFDPGSIRKTSKALGLQTESSRRFERGADPNLVLKALDRAAMLMQEIAGGQIAKGVLDVKKQEFPERVVSCRLRRINHILGTQLSLSEVEDELKRLHFHYHWDGEDLFTIHVPTYRVDIKGEIDIIEEIVRLYGYDKIKKQAGQYLSSRLPHSPIFLFEREVRARMIAEGLQEFITCDLISPSMIDMIKNEKILIDSIVKVRNPTSVDQSILRPSLMPGLLEVVKHNLSRQNNEIMGFEIGQIHYKSHDQFKEQSVVGIIVTGKSQQDCWDIEKTSNDFYDLKGILENFFTSLGIHNIQFKSIGIETFHPGRQASIYFDSLEVGSMGEIHPSIMRLVGITQRVLFAELNLSDLFRIRKEKSKMDPLPIYPGSGRDWTITLLEDTPIETVLAAVKKIPSTYLEEVRLSKPIYQSEKLGKGVKNATFHFFYRDWDKTIAQETVDVEHAKIISQASAMISSFIAH